MEHGTWKMEHKKHKVASVRSESPDAHARRKLHLLIIYNTYLQSRMEHF